MAKVAIAESDSSTSNLNHEFDAGSKISINKLTALQIENLVVTGKVWGFLKYHHPAVVAGQYKWDYELLRLLPRILSAEDRVSANKMLQVWTDQLGPVDECNPCISFEKKEFQLLPSLEWLSDSQLLGEGLRNSLYKIYRARNSKGNQFYVSLAPRVGNPVFDKEDAYIQAPFPDSGFQLLALFRYWNIVEYWSPYRDQIGEDWNNVLRESINPLMLAKSRSAYELEMMKVIARANDTHSNLWSSLSVRPPVGHCALPLQVRFVKGNAVINRYVDSETANTSGIRPGDVLEAIDGIPITQLVETLRPYYAASNEATRLRDIAANLTNGKCGDALISIRKDDKYKEITLVRTPRSGPQIQVRHDKAGETFQLITEDIAYIKLSSINRADVPSYMERASKTKGLIIDIRNYPSDFMPFVLGSYLVDKPTSFVRVTLADITNPGAFKWGSEITISPRGAGYKGKVIILVDEMSQSQSEYTAMALRASPHAIVVGSTTAGADGNISPVALPGGLKTMISGIGIFYPDKRPTQRIGIVPDIEVMPTISGLSKQQDEVLEAAIKLIQAEDSSQSSQRGDLGS